MRARPDCGGGNFAVFCNGRRSGGHVQAHANPPFTLTWRDLHLAGKIFLECRTLAPKPRHRVVADFLVAAHAFFHATELITRDRGFYRHYFPKLKITHVGPEV